MKTFTRLTQLLEELIPYLTKYQVEFLQHVDTIFEGMVSKSKPRSRVNSGEEVSEIESKLEVMQKNLDTIIERLKHELKEGSTDRKRFVEMYPKWREVRKNGTQKLKEIGDSLNSDRFNCNVSKLVGYCASFAGGALCLASAVLIPFTMGLTTPLAVAGGTVTAAGCTTAVGTSITEIVLLKKKVSQAQEIIEEDDRCYKEMCSWFKHATELQEALAEVLNIDIIKDVVEDVKNFVEKAFAIPKDHKWRQFIEKTLNVIIRRLPQKLTEAVSVIAVVSVISFLVGLFVLLINTKTRIVFDCTHFTMRSVLGIASFADDATDILRITRLFTSNAALAKDLAKAITRGALSIVGMALDVTGIALTSIDIHKGSLSPEAEKILKAAEELEKGTRTIDEVYDRLRII